MYSDQWELKYFDFGDFINSSNAEFIGRQWLYQEMESLLEHTNKRGVIITGNPGSGKSAFLSHLLCSRTSSPHIHGRILGYHFCMHFDRGTQSGAKFVRNLANMIAWRIAEYGQLISTDLFVRRVLYKECTQDPEWCFEQGILTPLKKLQQQRTEPWYVVIDALDECANDKAEILNMLKSKLLRFPKWLKLIVSSRNVSTIIASLDGLQRIELRSEDERNRNDIDTYLSLKVFSLKESIIHRIKTTLKIKDNEAPSQKIVAVLAEKSQGNFQFVKVVLDLWLASAESFTWDTIPTTSDSSYQLYFERKYGAPESFQSLRQIFEVLVAAYTPLKIHEMHSLLRLDNPTLDLEYEFMPKLEQVSLFLWHGSGDGLIQIYHTSLSEWLTSEDNKGMFYYIKKQNGHNRLARYYLKNAVENNLPLKPDEAFHLASHIVEGAPDEFMVQTFLSLPSDQINTTDSVTRATALHYSSSSWNADVTKLLVHHFSNVDCLDNDHRTPSFIAATSGHLDNLKILFQRGANLNHTSSYLDAEIASHSQDPITECKRKLCEYSILHTASQEGNVDVVKFLIRHNVNIMKTTGANNTALQLAAANGHLETVQTLRRAGEVLDGTALHHSAARGHNHIVQYLLREGMKDTCIHKIRSSLFSDEEDSELNSAKVRLYDNRHLYLRETALHAAIGSDHLSVIKTLLSEDQTAIDCPNSAGRRPLHEAVHSNKYNTLKLLLASGANANVQCQSRPLSSSIESFTPAKFARAHCPCGFTSLHIAATHGYHSVAELLINQKADVNALDCNGSTPLHVASCQDMPSLVALLVRSGADINARSLNGSTPLHSAAACFAKNVYWSLTNLGCDILATDREGMTALHYVVKDVSYVGPEYFVDLYVSNPKGWIENQRGTSQQQSKLDLQFTWLNAFVKLIESFAKLDRARKTAILRMEDKRNQTVFDKLEEITDTSSLLTGSSRTSGSLLVLSLTPFIFAYDITISEIVKSHVVALNKPYEPGLIPKALTKVLSRTYTSTFTKLNCSKLLSFVSLNFVHAVNTVLQAGVDVNCRDSSGLTPLLVYLRTGGRHMSKVLVKHNVEVKITCGDSFENSVLHLASYHKLHYLHYLSEFLLGSDNWRNYLQTKNAIFDYFLDRYDEENNKGKVETLKTGDGPLTSAILSHPNSSNVVDECFDADGYNLFHRAAQGANLVAIHKFLSWGANPLLETTGADEFSPLWLSVLYAVKYRPYLNLARPSVLTSLEIEIASFSASAILNHILRNGSMDVGCNKSRTDLTLYHIAASRGMWQFVAHLLSSSKIIGMDVNCPNKDGITPMYLAKFIGGDTCEWHSPWCKVVEVIKSYGGTHQYPPLETEYFLIFNVFFGMNPSSLFLALTEQEILTLQEGCGRDECRAYKARNVDLFKTSEELDRVQIDYQKKVDKCSTFMEDCPADIKTTLPHFSLVVLFFDRQQTLKFNFFYIRNSFVAFLDSEIERSKDLLSLATRPQAEMPCKDSQENHRPPTDRIDICSQYYEQDLETVLHDWYRSYKESLDLVLENSDEVKSSMSINGKLPRFLAKMNFALTAYDTTLSCDWQTVAIKYVQLSFQVRNVNFWNQAVYETNTVPSISDFLSKRMEKAILQHSEQSLQLVLKLASGEPSEHYNYLRILRFTKPPMWHETFSGIGNFG